ncbi:putative cobalt-precorrin-7 C(5)-methyltransferase [Clostridium pasteurianum DSM 525 = ATCC 6013]|uniref:Precorrin-6y C5,15-methyltransferase (Decarboxylating), CbiE subunit n=1 Tax=Clostridium pasteurianum DSM 525 = ATCC 6013 TaxID=1262449 RepID=A0A0H3J627_CLOPA|nr:precorrin-6y C5,15-methyltransferase (decarboxylating) subunit CbiE [Clostridium pasteurianum]AJA47363.1 putative cobalt-precorrin-7 C(5)-methyltransferase [Clostridium pasteurianum DSM 525 = ATCC 6013]AJA51351.1 putative cobalt-precorrin-7 C(5)-methyltransferase [Clostridium pasteurianum DSM 525 = ATCC 6013]AOZ74694.1 precorrin-6Y-methylase [Clostridium pasteurianum DSM 525 = ATCC 6013]AOZ78490.1 precorrin-6Y-methylase [Clostridium pasteurianum]ELP58700.1 precorrin-6y C5,15-methyltransfera
MIYIVGLGPGSREYMLVKTIDVLENSDIIIGFKRAMESIAFIKGENKVVVKNLKEILDIINNDADKSISIVASGDPCFYGISDYINRNYKGDLVTIPGVSSFQYLMAKLNKSWQGAYLGSLHGREEDFIEKVKKNKISIWLTDKVNSPKEICKSLFKESLLVKVYVGENLSYSDEKILIGKPEEFMHIEFYDLAVVVIENEIHKG